MFKVNNEYVKLKYLLFSKYALGFSKELCDETKKSKSVRNSKFRGTCHKTNQKKLIFSSKYYHNNIFVIYLKNAVDTNT